MLKPGCNHFVLEKGIELIGRIRDSLQAWGFNSEADRDLLKKLYGTDTNGRPRSGVFDDYLLLSACDSVNKEGDHKTDPDEYKNIMFKFLDEEIKRLTALKSDALLQDIERSKYRVDQTFLSHQAALDLYIRYDTYLSRETDRLLNRLERVRRMRKGQ
jgi:hypothetical protein